MHQTLLQKITIFQNCAQNPMIFEQNFLEIGEFLSRSRQECYMLHSKKAK